MRRREFITLVGGVAAAWPFVSHAQQQTLPVVGFLSSAAPGPSVDRVDAFRQGLAETGFQEGRDVVIEYRSAKGHYDLLPTLAAELVRHPVAVIAASAASVASWIILTLFLCLVGLCRNRPHAHQSAGKGHSNASP